MSNKLYKNNDVILKQTDSYNDLKNSTKPMINSIMLEGNKTSDELNMYTKDQINQLIAQVRNVRYLETIPADPQANTLYYIGTAKPYNVYLYIEDSSTGTLTRLDMGTTEIDLTEYQKSQDNNLQTTSKNIVGAINENRTNINQKQNITDNTLITTNKTIPTAINEIETDINDMPNNYAPFNSNAYNLDGVAVSADGVLWDFTPSGSARREQTRKAYGYITSPITGSNIYGTVETTILYSNATLCTIEQIFTELNPNNTVRFRRLGTAPAQTITFSTATITWQLWYPLEYPNTNATLTPMGSTYRVAGSARFNIAGGVLTFAIENINISYIDTSQSISPTASSFQFKIDQLQANIPFKTNQAIYSSLYKEPRDSTDSKCEMALVGITNESGLCYLRCYWLHPSTTQPYATGRYAGHIIQNLGY